MIRDRLGSGADVGTIPTMALTPSSPRFSALRTPNRAFLTALSILAFSIAFSIGCASFGEVGDSEDSSTTPRDPDPSKQSGSDDDDDGPTPTDPDPDAEEEPDPGPEPDPDCTPTLVSLLTNGNFDAGADVTWLKSRDDLILPSAEMAATPQSPDHAAWLGGINPSTHALAQAFSIPADATNLGRQRLSTCCDRRQRNRYRQARLLFARRRSASRRAGLVSALSREVTDRPAV